MQLCQKPLVVLSAGALLTLSVAQASPTQWQIEPDCLQSVPFSPRHCRFRFCQLDRWSIEQRYLDRQRQADPRDARIITRPTTPHLWRCRQSARHGIRDDFARCAGRPNALAQNRWQHDRHRYAGAQIPSSDGDSCEVQRQASIRSALLRQKWLRENYREDRCLYRRERFQQNVPKLLPPLRAVRDLAILRSRRIG